MRQQLSASGGDSSVASTHRCAYASHIYSASIGAGTGTSAGTDTDANEEEEQPRGTKEEHLRQRVVPDVACNAIGRGRGTSTRAYT